MKLGTIVGSTHANVRAKFHVNILTGSEMAKVGSFTVRSGPAPEGQSPSAPGHLP